MTAAAPGRGVLREAALRIARELCDTAVWDSASHRCNWMGRRDVVDGGADAGIASGALGPELYAGSAGVALFLAEAYGASGEARFLETALGALARSVAYLRHDPRGASPLSFHAGHLGVAWVLTRVRALEPAAGMDAELAWLVHGAAGAAPPEVPDVIVGHAGAIPALLRLARTPGLEEYRTVAERLGDDLLDRAVWEGDVCHWAPPPGQDRPAPLTGLSHGASGMALALAELADGAEGAHLRGARGGFAFEDRFFSADEGNWADTRFAMRRDGGRLDATFQNAWCHGAPGIALARARAAELDPERAEGHARMAAVAAATTREAALRRLDQEGADATLCHGLAGLSEVLLATTPEGARAAEVVAGRLVERYGEAGSWPSGVNAGGPNPSLMIGTAGIGHHLLRLVEPGAVEPVLVLR
ncbi:MAG TPA: lanthionine synthetase LanC family protein [Longimicrobium sp.]|jgi:lantibiotic modifying enzyme